MTVCAWLLAAMAASQDARLADSRIAARVNDEIITVEEMERLYAEAGLGADARDARRRLLQQEARNRLFLQEARKLSIQVTKEEIDRAIEETVRTLGGAEAYERWLTLNQKTRTAHREEQRMALIIQKVFSHKYQEWIRDPSSQAPALHDFVTPSEMRQYWQAHEQEFKAPESRSVIRISLAYSNDAERAEALRTARSILRRVEAGSHFGLEAQIHMKGQGAVLDNVTLSNKHFSREVMERIFGLAPGEMSGVLEDAGVLHIVRVTSRTEGSEHIEFEDAQPRIRMILRAEKQNRNRAILIEEMLKTAYYWPPDLFE